MTNLEALKGKIAGYPLSDNTYLTALMDRGLDPQKDYAGKSKEFDLAMADVYVVLATGVNVTEGGYQLSLTDKSNFLKIANKLYEKHGEKGPLSDDEPTITAISPW
jgi:hypothetical protein